MNRIIRYLKKINTAAISDAQAMENVEWIVPKAGRTGTGFSAYGI
jgi:hypothetical protein